MQKMDARQSDAVRSFWDRYIRYLAGKGVKAAVSRWYVIRAEQYIKAFPDKKLVSHCAEDVKGYLESQSVNNKILDWQFRQIVDAMQNLFAILEVDWLDEVDWQHWMQASTLPDSHSSIAREAPAEATISRLASVEGSELAKVRLQHGEILKQLLIVIRQRGYSIRTEQTYESWAARFIGYCGNRDPKTMGADEVVSYLQYLAVRRNVAASTQNQALNALVFFYDQVLQQPLGDMGGFIRAKRPKKLPVVLTKNEVQRLLPK